MTIKVGNLYGKAEVTSIQPGKIHFMCLCGNTFSTSSTIVRRQGAPRACTECINITNTVSCGPAAHNMDGINRKYTSKENQMIKDFEEGKT